MMTEKEKMVSGQPYIASDRQLTAERQRAKSLVFRFNSLPPDNQREQELLLRELFKKAGTKFHVEPPFRCDYGYNITVGESFYANYNLTILDCAAVTIGKNVMIAPNVSLFTAGHPVHFEPRIREIEYALPITIGDNVWIGGNTVVNPGVVIGNNSVIGSGSVVTKDVPDNVVAAGNPCRVIREIREEERGYYFRNLPL
ncbi:MAG: sugar O-acetyltransferase [Chitinophagaceae bacterium]|nr:MAG: sugar O-acetyltransferase [Chitinophagaceae bacterium]